MTERLTKREGSKLRLTREPRHKSPFDKLDVIRALGASHMIERTTSGGNPLARALEGSRRAGLLLAEADLSPEDVRLVEELLEHMRKRLTTVVDRGQILRALVLRELGELRRDPERVEQELAKYLAAASGDKQP